MSSDLSINPASTLSVDYLLGLFRLNHSNCLKISFSYQEKFTLFLSNSQSKTPERSMTHPNWEAGVLLPLLPFTEATSATLESCRTSRVQEPG